MCSAALFMSPLTNDSWALAMLLSGSVAKSLGACAETVGMATISAATRNARQTEELLLVILIVLHWLGCVPSESWPRSTSLVQAHRAEIGGRVVRAALLLANLPGAPRRGRVAARLRRDIVGAAVGCAHLARAQLEPARATGRCERNSQ